jgi:hypothetical protein
MQIRRIAKEPAMQRRSDQSSRRCNRRQFGLGVLGFRISTDLTFALLSGNGRGSQEAPAAPIQPDQKIRRSYILQDEPLSLGL